MRVREPPGQRLVDFDLAISAHRVAYLKQAGETPDPSGQLQGDVTGFPGELDNLGRASRFSMLSGPHTARCRAFKA